MIVISTPVLKRCPFLDEADHGHLTVTLPGDAPELHALGGQVDDLCAKPVTHEQFTRDVLAVLPAGASVVTRWQTGRWNVAVFEGSREVMPGADVLLPAERGSDAAGHA